MKHTRDGKQQPGPTPVASPEEERHVGLSRRDALRLCGTAVAGVAGVVWGCSSSSPGDLPGVDAGVDATPPPDAPPVADASASDGAADSAPADGADASHDAASPAPPPPELFLHCSDIHIGGGGFATPALQYTLGTLVPAATGFSLLATGDLVETGIDLESWQTYRNLVDAAGLTIDRFFEVPGNHDAFLDGALNQYRDYTVGGRHGLGTHYVTHVGPAGQRVRLVAINTASAGDPVRDGAGYLEGAQVDELLGIIAAQSEVPRATVVLGHHPPGALGLFNTEQHLQRLLTETGAVAYLFGHVHVYAVSWADTLLRAQATNHGSPGASPDESHPGFSCFALDAGPVVKNIPLLGDAASVHLQFPVVMITRPANRGLAVNTAAGERNPWAEALPRATGGHLVRAVALAPGGVESVSCRVGGGAAQPLQPVGSHYEATFTTPDAAWCTIEVTATAGGQSASDIISVDLV